MNIQTMMDALLVELTRATGHLQLEVPSGDPRAPQIIDGYLLPKRPKDPQAVNDFPYVIARYLSDVSTDDEGVVQVKIICGIFSEDDQRGWRDLLNLTNTIKTHLLSNQYFGESFFVQRPLKREFPEEQPAPEWVGWFTLTISIPNIMEVNRDVQDFLAGH